MSRDAATREKARETLLLATLPHVAFDGWSLTAMIAGASDAGMSAVEARRYFPGGPAEMVRLFSEWADARMLERLEEAPLEEMRIRDRVAFAVWARIEALFPYREVARRTLSFFALPAHAPLGASCLYRTVDAIWYGIGDRSTDFSFYTKRALLAGVVSSTTLNWLQDSSEGSADTRAFLERRIADVMRLQRASARLESITSRLPDPFRLARLMGERR